MRLDQLFRSVTRPLTRVFWNLQRSILGVLAWPGKVFQRQTGGAAKWLSAVTSPFRLLWWTLNAPVRILRSGNARRNQHFVAGIPALAVLVVFLSLIGYAAFSRASIKNRYRSLGRSAINKNDFRLAKTFFGRLVNNGSQDSEDLFNWAVALGKTGDVERAKSIMERLAPPLGTTAGYAPAHRYKALSALQQIGDKAAPDFLASVRWHLENSGDARSQEIAQAWAIYYIAVRQPNNAIPFMLRAAELNPEFLLSVAAIHKDQGNDVARTLALRKAESLFTGLLTRDPLNHRHRGLLAKTLVAQGRLDEAERLLRSGMELRPDLEIQRSLADFLLLRHDNAVKDGKEFEEQFRYLQDSLTVNTENLRAYQSLIGLRRRTGDGREAKALIALLNQTIASGKAGALAHFALGNVLWLGDDFDTSRWHLERAYRLDERFAVIANNLAWLLAHGDPPELERAYVLAESIVKEEPEEARFRDTLATIFMLQEKYDEALLEFEKALPSIPEKGPVHEKLAVVYQKLGKQEMARLHAKLAKKGQEQ